MQTCRKGLWQEHATFATKTAGQSIALNSSDVYLYIIKGSFEEKLRVTDNMQV